MLGITRRIIQAGDKSPLGYFDFHNAANDSFKSQVPPAVNAGWGILEHRPEYTGAKHILVSADVYRKPDGSFDLSKGVYGLLVTDYKTGRTFSLERDETPLVWGGPAKTVNPNSPWKVEVGDKGGNPKPTFVSSTRTDYSNSPAFLAEGEVQAVRDIDRILTAAGLPK